MIVLWKAVKKKELINSNFSIKCTQQIIVVWVWLTYNTKININESLGIDI